MTYDICHSTRQEGLVGILDEVELKNLPLILPPEAYDRYCLFCNKLFCVWTADVVAPTISCQSFHQERKRFDFLTANHDVGRSGIRGL